MAVNFLFSEIRITLSERERLKLFIEAVFKRNKKKLRSLTYIFCSDPFLLEINKQFLKHDDYTDIITFNLSYPAKDIEGEVYISTDRVRENAQNLAIPLKEELHRVIFHGALHLCGYSDKTKNEKQRMRSAEDKCLELYFS